MNQEPEETNKAPDDSAKSPGEREKEKPFAGAPLGNQNSTKDKRWWGATLRRALAQRDGEVIRELAEKLIDKARQGDVPALKELGDRIDGRAIQSTWLSGPDDAKLPQFVGIIAVPEIPPAPEKTDA